MNNNKNFAKFINIDGKYRFYNDESDLIKIQQEEIDQLTNNWNELEEWVRKLIDDNNNRYELYKDDKLHYEYEISNIKYQNNMLVAFLDKMKEIKEGNNVSSRD